MAVNSSALQVTAMCHGQEAAEENPAHSRAVKSIAAHPTAHCTWRANCFDLVITNKDDTKVNQTKVNKGKP